MQTCAAQHRGEQHQIGQASGLMIRMQRNDRRPRLNRDALGGMGQQACGIGQHGQCRDHVRRHLRRDDLTHPGAGHLGQRVGTQAIDLSGLFAHSLIERSSTLDGGSDGVSDRVFQMI
jgi:hypothetical protein